MKFLISVIDNLSGSGTPEEMIAIDAFNEGLRASGYFVFAGGLTDPKGAIMIDNRGGANISTNAPLFAAEENLKVWIIETANDAINLSIAGAIIAYFN